ncbi:MAG: hypothetical protein AB8F94_27390 [Saprospiraceae bacterium]
MKPESKRLVAENKIEEYLNLINKEYFHSTVLYPIYEKKDKISKVKEMEKEVERFEIVYDEIYALIEPDKYVERELFLQVKKNDTIKFDSCYIIKYQTNLFIETKNPTTKAFGYGNFLVDKNNLNVFILPSSHSDEYWSKDYSKHVNNEKRDNNLDWIPINLNKEIIQFYISGPIEIKSKE